MGLGIKAAHKGFRKRKVQKRLSSYDRQKKARRHPRQRIGYRKK